MKYSKQIMAILLIAVLIICSLPLTGFAAETQPVKEEVIYINLNSDGSVKEINAVNIFNLNKDGKITDYGEYESLRNMTTTDKINYSDDTVSIETKKGKLYYEGKLKNNIIPWDISIHYYLDEKEYSAKELAGKSGSLKITMVINNNTEYNGNFHEGYALQTTFTLDTDKCCNISANGATIANVGNDKQLTYTLLPGKAADIVITADVTDFEMEAVSINALKLNLDIDVDDTEIKTKVKDITDAGSLLNSAAYDLNDGAKKLYEGTSLLQNKTSELVTGIAALNTGTSELASGLSAVISQNDALLNAASSTFQALCATAETTLNTELSAYGLPTVSLTPDSYEAVLNQLLSMLGDTPAAASITTLKNQLDNYKQFYEGLTSYAASVSNISGGANTLTQNMNNLYSNSSLLSTSVSELNSGMKSLYDGTEKLKSGTNEFTKKTAGIDTEINTTIESMISSATGSDIEISSFISEKNTNVNAVQFVIKTDAIKKAEIVEVEAEKEENLSFWEKLVRLFKNS